VHQKREQALRPVYSIEQVQRYIRYARYFSPRISEESLELLVRHYRKLRENDAGSGSKSAYRMTVRQLESMIRLSEARARIHCDEEVRPAYVEEAARLLKKSLIHVETERIVLSDFNPQGAHEDESISRSHLAPCTDPPTKPLEKIQQDESSGLAEPLMLSYEEYKKISHQLIQYLKQQEASGESNGLTREDLVGWYVEQKADQLNSEDELKRITRISQLIVDRLVTRDGALLEDKSGSLSVHPCLG
jgi:DNA replication licensing factor MCM6